MAKQTWLDLITKVLEEEKRSLHYTEIAELIFEREYKEQGSGGATPANTVNKQLNSSINDLKTQSPYAKVGMGEFILRKYLDTDTEPETNSEAAIDSTVLAPSKEDNNRVINAFGIHWNRDLVHWKTSPDLLGIQQVGATQVNFQEQKGIYLLHDSRETIYVGQAIEQSLAQRLRQHTTDRLGGRWDRFSWFGLFPINEHGQLDEGNFIPAITSQVIGNTLEAILIESIEPRQNRKQGNTFAGIEYLQIEAPEIKKIKKEQLLRELTDKL